MLRTYSYRKSLFQLLSNLPLLYTKSSSVVAIKPTGLSFTVLPFQKRILLFIKRFNPNSKNWPSLPHFSITFINKKSDYSKHL